MPKVNIEFPHYIALRISDTQKKNLLDINKQYAIPAREALMQYLPIMKTMQNPMAIPRDIVLGSHKLTFSANPDGEFCLTVNGEDIIIPSEELKTMLANIFMFTLNTELA